jgi:hypothetical protein
LLIGDKQHRIGMDGGEQLGRHLSFLDSGATEEEWKKNGRMVKDLVWPSLRIFVVFAETEKNHGYLNKGSQSPY